LVSKDYDTVKDAITSMSYFGSHVDDAISIGIGAGDNRQSKVVSDIAKDYQGSHINKVFTSVGQTTANTHDTSWVNALVSPTGRVGYVNVSRVPIRSEDYEKQ